MMLHQSENPYAASQMMIVEETKAKKEAASKSGKVSASDDPTSDSEDDVKADTELHKSLGDVEEMHSLNLKKESEDIGGMFGDGFKAEKVRVFFVFSFFWGGFFRL